MMFVPPFSPTLALEFLMRRKWKLRHIALRQTADCRPVHSFDCWMRLTSPSQSPKLFADEPPTVASIVTGMI